VRTSLTDSTLRLYASVLLAMQLFAYAHAAATDLRPVLLVDAVVSAVALVGLFGHAWGRRARAPRLWRALAVALPVWDALFSFVLYRRPGQEDLLLAAVIPLLFAPEWIALWRHGRPASLAPPAAPRARRAPPDARPN
jgi:hypothetical protein